MRIVRRKTGGHVNILSRGETCPKGEICFDEEEYAWAQKISAGYSSDPEALKSFWEALFEKKESIPGYLLYSDFPLDVEAAPESVAKRYSREILDMLKARPRVEEKEVEENFNEFRFRLGKLIEEGAHLPKKDSRE